MDRAALRAKATVDAQGGYVSGSILQHCRIEYGGGSFAAGAVGAFGAAPYLDACTITDSAAAACGWDATRL